MFYKEFKKKMQKLLKDHEESWEKGWETGDKDVWPEELPSFEDWFEDFLAFREGGE